MAEYEKENGTQYIDVVVVSHATTFKMSREVAHRNGLDAIHVYLVIHREQLLVQKRELIPVRSLEMQISAVPILLSKSSYDICV